jgi:protein YibB
MTNITIVTAFFDIGRSEWTPDKGLPHYLQRSTETYIERFSHMAQLENDMVIFSTPDIIKQLRPLRAGKNTQFFEIDLIQYSYIRTRIENAQKNPSFQNMIHPSQRLNPEYWNSDYVLVNFLKTVFVNLAIRMGYVHTDLVAWLDFGYCRTPDKIPASKKWSYDFDPSKMHLFKYHDERPSLSLYDIISNNFVHILGAKIVGGKEVWPKMEELMWNQFNTLLANHLIDDDQTLLYMSALEKPELFEMHKIPDHQLGLDPFVIFSNFNKEV